MTKTTRNLALLAIVALIAAGCTTLLNTQADFWADQAEQIARDCPAAGEFARQARQAADDAAGATAGVAQANLETEAMREQLQRELEQAESALLHIQIEGNAIDKAIIIKDNNQESDDIARVNWRADWYQRRANCLSAGGRSAECEATSEFGGEARVHHCETASDCEQQSQMFRMSGRMAQDNDRPALEEMLIENRTKIFEAEARVAAARINLENYSKSSSNLEQTRRTQNQQGATEYATTAENAYQEAQRIAAEQCGEGAALQDAPPNPSLPSGEYPQDILNSQPMGLPGGPAPLVCPVACAAITTAWCTFNCLSSPGDPPQCGQCAFCTSQGCP